MDAISVVVHVFLYGLFTWGLFKVCTRCLAQIRIRKGTNDDPLAYIHAGVYGCISIICVVVGLFVAFRFIDAVISCIRLI